VGSDAVFEVTNFGSGISTRDRPYIFDRFYRADLSRSSQNVEGYGLGLSLAKQITALHNGQISAKSQLEKTTTFTIVFPQNQIEATV
jgi:two-component system phosphate regulon sensor histidine kinase PhoR